MGKRRYYLSTTDPTKHHIIPRSRGGEDDQSNIAIVKNQDHETYHAMFSNMTPVEIITQLAEYYWAGQWEHVVQAIEENCYVDRNGQVQKV